MTDARCPTPIDFVAIVDYWTDELPESAADEVENHVFTCPGCADRLAQGEALARGIVAVAREGRFHSLVTDEVLNRLARDGVRIRAYALEPGDLVPCAIWADDDLVVTRLRADLDGIDSVAVVTRLASGEEVSRLSDVPVRPGQGEIIRAIPASALRQLPAGRVRLTLTGRTAGVERTIGEYVLDHAGTFDRSS